MARRNNVIQSERSVSGRKTKTAKSIVGKRDSALVKKSRNLTPAIRRTLINFIHQLNVREVPFVRVYIFGSVARGTNTPQSDIDLCVVLVDKVKKDIRKYWISAMGAATDLMLNADVVVFTQLDFETNELSPLLHEIKKKNIQVF